MRLPRPYRSTPRAYSLALVVVCCFGAVWGARANQWPVESSMKSTVPGMPAPTAGEVSKGWFKQLFTKPAGDAKQQAIEQIEALGLTLDANSCNRAVAAKNQRLIHLFLASGFDLNSRGDRGRTPLLVAALQPDWALVGELIKAGANPNLADDAGATPLMSAAMAPNVAPVQQLLKAGADAQAKDARGHTALHYAVSAQSPTNIAALIAANCPVAGRCCDGCDLLTHAFETGRKEIITPVLEAQANDLAWTHEARAFLAGTITARDAKLTKLVLSKYPEPPTPEGKAQPLLGYVLLDGDLATFKYLLDCGADANTPLNSPVEKDFSGRVSSAFCRLYLDNEAGMTTLMLAAGMEKIDYVKTLLEHGAKRWAATTKYKMPALFFAAHSEIAEIMQMLIGESSPTPDQMRIEISLGSQRLYLFKDGVSVFSAPVSTGRPGFSTPAGRFVITDKHLVHTSTIYKTAQMPFFMRLNCRDFGMHEGQLPGYPASHGCIRLPGSAARQLFKDVPVGTLVSISH